ncbi:MAG: hypothetical protein QNK37_20535 [Acidobacteriota bacterium]|nr:hypothetical protein [Acidobacteriota bacterium]
MEDHKTGLSQSFRDKLEDRSRSLHAQVALTFGLFSTIVFLFLMPGIVFLTAPVSILFGIKGLRSSKRTMAMLGIVLSGIPLLLISINVII